MWWKRSLAVLALVGLLGMVGWQETKFIENADRVHRAQVQETVHARLLLEENTKLLSLLKSSEFDRAVTFAKQNREFAGRLAELSAQNDQLFEALSEAEKQAKSVVEIEKNLNDLFDKFFKHESKINADHYFLLDEARKIIDRLGVLKRWPSVPLFMRDATVRIGMSEGPDADPREARFCIGSGFKIGTHVIGTAKHVAQDELGVQRPGLKVEIDGKWVPVSATFVDPDHDLALLIMQPELTGVIPVPRSVSIEEFDPLFIVGNPAGTTITATHGFLSTKESLWNAIVGEPWWQTGANAYGGNSGGPVFDANTGDLIGVLVAGVRGAPNVSMFVPVEHVRALLDRYEHTAP